MSKIVTWMVGSKNAGLLKCILNKEIRNLNIYIHIYIYIIYGLLIIITNQRSIM